MPDSMIVVHTSTSYWPSQKSSTTRSSRPSSIWPWATAMRASGTSSRSRGGHPVDVLHPVVHEEDLALPQQLPADRLGHRPLVVLAHVGEDGLALGGGGVEDGEVADAGEAHLQGAGDGRGREGEHVDVGPQAA